MCIAIWRDTKTTNITNHYSMVRELSRQRISCNIKDQRKQFSLLLMQEANHHLKAWQSAELKSLMSKPSRHQDLERIWQPPKRTKQIELDIASHAKALSELYHDDATVQAEDSTVDTADIKLFQWGN